MKWFGSLVFMSLFSIFALIATTGCEEEDDSSSSSDTTTTATGTTGTAAGDTPSNLPGTAPASIAVGAQSAGSSADSNRETDNFGNSSIWVGGSLSIGVRCLANDLSSSMGNGYFCDDVVSDGGGLHIYVSGQAAAAVGADFTSSNSGLVYKFKGFKANSSSSSLITENPHVITAGERSGTFRAYWDTYAAP